MALFRAPIKVRLHESGQYAIEDAILVVDASIRETHVVSAQATEHEVQSGVAITDHVRVMPLALTLRGVISDDTMTYLPSIGITEAKVPKSQSAWDTLIERTQQGEPIDILTSLKVYRNMLIGRTSVDRDKTSGAALVFNAEMREIRIIDTDTGLADDLLSGPVSLGSIPMEELGAAEAAAVGVLLASVFVSELALISGSSPATAVGM